MTTTPIEPVEDPEIAPPDAPNPFLDPVPDPDRIEPEPVPEPDPT